jgi:adenine nucleotide transporter 17
MPVSTRLFSASALPTSSTTTVWMNRLGFCHTDSLGYEWSRAGFERAALRAGRVGGLTTLESMAAGALAGSATVLITNPIWVVNTRMTARSKEVDLPGVQAKKQPGTIETTMALIKDEGLKSLFAGVMPALVLVINPILQYTVFEQLKSVLEKRRKVTPMDAFYLGALGKLVATSVTYPYITVKSRMHVAGKDGSQGGIMGSLRRIIAQEGYGGLYKGIGPKIIQSVITAAFLFAFKDALYDMTVKARSVSVKKAVDIAK